MRPHSAFQAPGEFWIQKLKNKHFTWWAGALEFRYTCLAKAGFENRKKNARSQRRDFQKKGLKGGGKVPTKHQKYVWLTSITLYILKNVALHFDCNGKLLHLKLLTACIRCPALTDSVRLWPQKLKTYSYPEKSSILDSEAWVAMRRLFGTHTLFPGESLWPLGPIWFSHFRVPGILSSDNVLLHDKITVKIRPCEFRWYSGRFRVSRGHFGRF